MKKRKKKKKKESKKNLRADKKSTGKSWEMKKN